MNHVRITLNPFNRNFFGRLEFKMLKVTYFYVKLSIGGKHYRRQINKRRVKQRESSLTSLLCQATYQSLSVSLFFLLLKQTHLSSSQCQILFTGEEFQLRSATEVEASGRNGRRPDTFLTSMVRNILIRFSSEVSQSRISIVAVTETVTACGNHRQ